MMNRLALVAVLCVQVACLWHVSSGADNAGIAIVAFEGTLADTCAPANLTEAQFVLDSVCGGSDDILIEATENSGNQTLTFHLCNTTCYCTNPYVVEGPYGFCEDILDSYISAWPIEIADWNIGLFVDGACSVPVPNGNNGTYAGNTCAEAPNGLSEYADETIYVLGGLLKTTSGPTKAIACFHDSSACGGDPIICTLAEESTCFSATVDEIEVSAIITRASGSGGSSSSTESGGSSSTGSGGSSSTTGSGGSSSSSSGSSSSFGFRLSDFFFMMALAVGAASFAVVFD